MLTTRTALLSSRALPASPPLRRRATAAWMPYPMRSLGAGHGKQGNTGYSLSGSTRPRARHLRMRIEECKREREEFFCCCSNTRNKKRRGQQRSLSLCLCSSVAREPPLSRIPETRGDRPGQPSLLGREEKRSRSCADTRERENGKKETMPSSSSSALSASLLRGLSPSRTASGLMRRNSASSETSSAGGGGGTEPRHGSLTERLGRLSRRRSSHSGELRDKSMAVFSLLGRHGLRSLSLFFRLFAASPAPS